VITITLTRSFLPPSWAVTADRLINLQRSLQARQNIDTAQAVIKIDEPISTHFLSPSSLGLELSSQTQLEYKRGLATISIKAHSLSPSSLGLALSSQTQLETKRGLAAIKVVKNYSFSLLFFAGFLTETQRDHDRKPLVCDENKGYRRR